MKKIQNKLLLIAGLCCIIFAMYQKAKTNVVIPNKNKLELTTNIFYDELEKCQSLAESYDKKIILIFGTDWCPYCKELKRNINNIQGISRYLVCIIDTDKNKILTEKFQIKALPTSIIIDYKNNELSRKMGYVQVDYEKWLNLENTND